MGQRVQLTDDITGRDVSEVITVTIGIGEDVWMVEVGTDTAQTLRDRNADMIEAACRIYGGEDTEPSADYREPASWETEPQETDLHREEGTQETDLRREEGTRETDLHREEGTRETVPATGKPTPEDLRRYGAVLCDWDSAASLRQWWADNEMRLGRPYSAGGRVPIDIHRAYHEHADGARRVRAGWAPKVYV